MIDDETLERAKKYPITDLAQRLGIEIKNNTCRCISPDHEDKHPSMSFVKEINIFKCYSCPFTGDTIKFVRTITNLGFRGAVELILNENSTQRTGYSVKPLKHPLKRQISDSREAGEKYSDIYNYFIDLLPFPDNDHYLVANRKISIDILKNNNIRNIPKKDDKYYYFNKLSKIFPKDKVKESGLFPIIFNCCAIIPFYKDDKIVYVQGITKPELRKEAKVYNLASIEMPVIYAPKTLGNEPIHICEGIITSLYFSTKGYNSIAIISGSNSPEKITSELIPYKNSEFIMCPDIDPIGLKVIESLHTEMLKHGFRCNSNYFNPMEFGRKFNLKTRDIYKIKDFNDLRNYIEK